MVCDCSERGFWKPVNVASVHSFRMVKLYPGSVSPPAFQVPRIPSLKIEIQLDREGQVPRASLLLLTLLFLVLASSLAYWILTLSFSIRSERTLNPAHSENGSVGIACWINVTSLSEMNSILEDAQLQYRLRRRIIRGQHSRNQNIRLVYPVRLFEIFETLGVTNWIHPIKPADCREY